MGRRDIPGAMFLWTALLLADVPLEAWARPVDVAAAGLRASALRLAAESEAIAAGGRIERLAELDTDARDVVARARTLGLAARK